MADSTPDAIHAAFKNAPDIREHWEREAFEAWGAEMMRWGGADQATIDLTMKRVPVESPSAMAGEYAEGRTEARWQAWKARASLNPPPADAKPDAEFRREPCPGERAPEGHECHRSSDCCYCRGRAKPQPAQDVLLTAAQAVVAQADRIRLRGPGVAAKNPAVERLRSALATRPAQDALRVERWPVIGLLRRSAKALRGGTTLAERSSIASSLEGAADTLASLATQPAQDDLRACANVLDDAAESLRKLMNGGGSQVRAVEFWAKRLRSIATQPAQEQEQEQGRTDTERMDWLEQEAPDIDRDALGNAVVTFSTTEDGTGLDTVEECTLREAVDAAMLAAEREAGGSA